jgi:hypothetical protein
LFPASLADIERESFGVEWIFRQPAHGFLAQRSAGFALDPPSFEQEIDLELTAWQISCLL